MEARLSEVEKKLKEPVASEKAVLVGKDEIEAAVKKIVGVEHFADVFKARNVLTGKETEYIKKSERGLCPKCKVKPNHFFHVKTCSGPPK